MRALVFAAAFFAAGAAYAEPVTYTLDTAHTQVGFTIDRFGFNRVMGQFSGVTGELVLDEANPAQSSVHATIPVASLSAGDATREEHVRGERWLKAAQFPNMEFRSTAVRMTGERTAEVTGELTMLGLTHPVTLNVTLNHIGGPPNAPNRRMAGFSATGSLTRSTWGLTQATSPGMIGDTVTISIEALATPAQAAQ
jgi:polyisoprenoid-binding protein YceI